MDYSIPPHALKKLNDYLYEIPRSFRPDMRVPARIYVSSVLLKQILQDRSLWQIVNVATLPGIQKYAIAMADIHEGYGFPIGGVAAMAIHEDGVISPGGIGYDINCGVRLLASNISVADIKPHLKKLAHAIFLAVPSGVGHGGPMKLTTKELDKVLEKGAARLLELGLGQKEDIEYCEESGCYKGADKDAVSLEARNRGHDQLGTLGSGNHFLEIQVVSDIFDEETASAFGLKEGDVTVMIHCGSRGLGHQVCTDYVRTMLTELSSFNEKIIDRQLASAPFHSPQGQAYFRAMIASANFAFANRHLIGHRVREAFLSVLGPSVSLKTVYDVAHNIGKLEKHSVDGHLKELLVHRKGATRAFGPNSPGLPKNYRAVGQPVLIPGTMGTASYVLAGTKEGMDQAFGSACHGAGRAMSRHAAKKAISGRALKDELNAQGIEVETDYQRGLAEEAPIAYKDVEAVVDVIDGAHLARKVARLKPIAVIKGD
ncbi:MAG TPA: RtcB family protein [Myxococcota bacterium]|nr:RtcB family protein [Myxococcota bacterium]